MNKDKELIAEFMGLSSTVEVFETPHGSCREIEVVTYFDEGREVKCDYDTSWDSLMPVVIKINSFYDGTKPFVFGKPSRTELIIKEKYVKLHSTFYFKCDPSSVCGNDWVTINKKFKIKNNNSLEATFDSVVYFITWFNNIKNGK